MKYPLIATREYTIEARNKIHEFNEWVKGVNVEQTPKEVIDESYSQAQAYQKYIKDKKLKNLLSGSIRLIEVKVGEYLGPPKTRNETGRGKKSSLGEEIIHDKVKKEFREMAEHKDIVEDLVDQAAETGAPVTRSAILKEIEKQDQQEEKPKPKPKPSIKAKQGQWYQLGEHYLYCGDSTSDEFKTEAATEKYVMAFADPPYGSTKEKWDTAFFWEHDYLSDLANHIFVTPGIANAMQFDTTMDYLWMLSCNIKNGMTRSPFGFSNWIPVFYFLGHGGKKPKDQLQDRFDIAITGNSAKHKGQKPVQLLLWLLRNFTAKGDWVIDPFLGSGTTLIACEDRGRRCVGAELSEKYCTAIIGRWEELTGAKANVY